MKLPKSVIAILMLFGSMMILVTVTAYIRRSGNTGIDVAKMEQMRRIAQAEK